MIHKTKTSTRKRWSERVRRQGLEPRTRGLRVGFLLYRPVLAGYVRCYLVSSLQVNGETGCQPVPPAVAPDHHHRAPIEHRDRPWCSTVGRHIDTAATPNPRILRPLLGAEQGSSGIGGMVPGHVGRSGVGFGDVQGGAGGRGLFAEYVEGRGGVVAGEGG